MFKYLSVPAIYLLTWSDTRDLLNSQGGWVDPWAYCDDQYTNQVYLHNPLYHEFRAADPYHRSRPSCYLLGTKALVDMIRDADAVYVRIYLMYLRSVGR